MGQSEKKIIDIKPITPGQKASTLLQPDLRLLYTSRAKRLRALSDDHAMQGYLSFAADIVEIQEKVLKELPYPAHGKGKKLLVDWKVAPLSKLKHKPDAHWLALLKQILKHMLALPQYKEGMITEVIKSIQKLNDDDINEKAQHLLKGEFAAVGSDTAPFIWAALSLYWGELARAHALDLHETAGVDRHICPVCGSDPVASLITLGPPEGLRYLHCNLCESQWHYVRAQCSNCEESQKIVYWTLDDEDSPIKTESCGSCMSHLKIFHQNRDVSLEAVADDLASLALDAHMEEKGFARSTFNPFLFPQEVVNEEE